MKNFKILTTVFSMLLLSACSSNIVTPYPPKINPSIEKISQDAQANAEIKKYEDEKSSYDSVLYDMELGRLNQIQGNLKESIKFYGDAIEDVKDDEEKAIVSGSSIGAQAAATLINDNAVPYTGKTYEHIMLHTNQALNYMFSNDIENAAPEIRLAGDNQIKAQENNQKAIDEAKEKSDENTRKAKDFINKNYAGLDEVAGKVKNQFQNAYAFYIAGVIYELNDEKDQAYLDYKNALEINPQNTYFQREAIRLAKELGNEDDAKDFKRKFPASYNYVETNKGNQNLVVLIEDGFVAQKEEVKLPLPVDLKGGITTLNFPKFKGKYANPSSFSVSQDNKNLGTANVACDFNAISYNAFKDDIVGIVVRHILRTASRVVAQQAANKIDNPIGRFFTKLGADAADVAIANADLRGWYTLPADAQVFSANLKAGEHTITIKDSKDGKKVDVKVNIADGKKSIIRVIKANNAYYTQSINL